MRHGDGPWADLGMTFTVDHVVHRLVAVALEVARDTRLELLQVELQRPRRYIEQDTDACRVPGHRRVQPAWPSPSR